MLNEFRNRIKPWLEKAARPFAKAGIRPNHITFIALLVGSSAAILFSLKETGLAGIVILFGGFFDMIDGTVARLTGRVTQFGGILDSVSDRLTDSFLYLGVMAGGVGALSGEPSWLLPALALIGSLLVSYTRARAESEGTGKLDVGIAERAERLIILAFGALAGLTAYALVVIIILTAITVAQRVWTAQQRLAHPLAVFE